MMEAIPFDRSVLKVNQLILMLGLVGGYFAGLAVHGFMYVLPVLAVMMLAATMGSTIRLETNGPDESAAMSAMVQLIVDRFGEAI